MSVPTLTDGEKKYVEKQMKEKGDTPVFVGWVNQKNKKNKPQPRLLVIGRYRVLLVTKGTLSKDVSFESHLFQVQQVSQPGPKHCDLGFKDGSWVGFYSEVTERIVQHLCTSIQRITHIFADEERVNGVTYSPDFPPCEAFAETYKAYCNEMKLPIKKLFLDFLKTLEVAKDHALALGDCPGIEVADRKERIDLTPIFRTLAHDKYFTELHLHRASTRKEIIPLLAEAMKKNAGLRALGLSYLEADRGWSDLGAAMAMNGNHSVRDINFSFNSLGEAGAGGLSQALSAYRHDLTKLNVKACSIPPKSMANLLNALSNTCVLFKLEELDISGNELKQEGSFALGEWCRKIKMSTTPHSALHTLLISRTSPDYSLIFTDWSDVVVAGLKELDVSFNQLSPLGLTPLCRALKTARDMKIFNLSSTALNPELLDQMMVVLRENTALQRLKLDLSCNKFAHDGMAVVNSTSTCSTVHTLNLRSTNLGKYTTDVCEMITSKSLTLKVVDISLNIPGDAKQKPSLSGIHHLIKNHPTMQVLKLRGDDRQFFLGPDIAQILDALPHSRSLKSLDITGNRMGDRGASALAEALRENTSLLFLMFDKNRCSQTGWLAMKGSLAVNKTICDIAYPIDDIEACKPRDRAFNLDIWNSINQQLDFNRQANPNVVPIAPAEQAQLTSNAAILRRGTVLTKGMRMRGATTNRPPGPSKPPAKVAGGAPQQQAAATAAAQQQQQSLAPPSIHVDAAPAQAGGNSMSPPRTSSTSSAGGTMANRRKSNLNFKLQDEDFFDDDDDDDDDDDNGRSGRAAGGVAALTAAMAPPEPAQQQQQQPQQYAPAPTLQQQQPPPQQQQQQAAYPVAAPVQAAVQQPAAVAQPAYPSAPASVEQSTRQATVQLGEAALPPAAAPAPEPEYPPAPVPAPMPEPAAVAPAAVTPASAVPPLTAAVAASPATAARSPRGTASPRPPPENTENLDDIGYYDDEGVFHYFEDEGYYDDDGIFHYYDEDEEEALKEEYVEEVGNYDVGE